MSKTEQIIQHGAQRDDALRPAVFNPADFAVTGYVDLDEFRDGGMGGAIREWEQDIIRIFGERGRDFVEQRENTGRNPLWVCDHCGAKNLRYIAAVRQASTGAIFVFGSSCVARAELTDRKEFDLVKLKKLAAGRRARAQLAEKQARYLNVNADIREFILSIPRGDDGEPTHSFNFVNSMDLALNKYGELTVRQAEVLRKVIAEEPERARIDAERAEREAKKGPAPEGRQTVRGEIVKIKSQEGFGYQDVVWKMVVRLENDSAVWVSVPKRLEDDFYAWQQKALDDFRTEHTAFVTKVREAFDEKIERHAIETNMPEEDRERWRKAFQTYDLRGMIDFVADDAGIPVPELEQRTLAGFLEGRKVELTATFTVSDRDEHFAFGKRPIVKYIDDNDKENDS